MLAILRSTRGLQRFMLFAGLALVLVFLVLAVFAPWIAPYGFSADRTGDTVFGTQVAPVVRREVAARERSARPQGTRVETAGDSGTLR